MNSVNDLDFERKRKFDAYGHMRGGQFFQALLVSILGILNSGVAIPVSLHFYWPSSGAAAIVLKLKYCFCCLFYCCQEGQRANDMRACNARAVTVVHLNAYRVVTFVMFLLYPVCFSPVTLYFHRYLRQFFCIYLVGKMQILK